ncbi:PiggyBac transposable element-derived protein 4 [Trichinella papuae]|uniref:PiggyBac transposable element-derived protein 4 n=1 Tax=Trichinella papuae TaxID=268474 RepID=A0A0V1M5R8_9BILA|nr:PiggyBac transposable element-derived protein 4 [Trichinella papuae]
MHDKMAPIRSVSEKFVRNCRESFFPNAHLCVDEQLLPFRGRCPFRVYIKSKPHGYGIKLWTLCDSVTMYVWNFQVYCGKMGPRPERDQGRRVVLDLVQGLEKGYGVTTDNFFTSLPLARDLLSQGKTLTGTIRWMRKEVPSCLRPNQTDALHSSKFLFTEDAMLASYVPKKGRNVILLSTQHMDDDVGDEDQDWKPHVILEYNACKGGVDAMDKMVREYSCCRNTKRWPLLLFMNMLDVAAVNAFVVFMTKFPTFYGNKSHRKRLFLKDLGMQLVRPSIERRASGNFSGLQKNIQRCILMVLKEEHVPKNTRNEETSSRKRGRCGLCVPRGDRKYSTKCDHCQKFVCAEHCTSTKTYLCLECTDQE